MDIIISSKTLKQQKQTISTYLYSINLNSIFTKKIKKAV